jgi:hypothetical protein
MPVRLLVHGEVFDLRPWEPGEIQAIIREMRKRHVPFMIASRRRLERGRMAQEARESGPRLVHGIWEYVPIVDEESVRSIVAQEQRKVFDVLKTELHLVRGYSDRADLPKTTQDVRCETKDLDILVSTDAPFTEVTFGLHLAEHPYADDHLTDGSFEGYVDDLMAFLETVCAATTPAFGRITSSTSMIERLEQTIVDHRLPENEIAWAMVFGPPYVEEYGRDFLLNAPGHRVEELENGSILFQATEAFLAWEDPKPVKRRLERYFRLQKKLKRARYRPAEARRHMTPKAYKAALERRRQTPTAFDEEPPPRVWPVYDRAGLEEAVTAAVEMAQDKWGLRLDFSPDQLEVLDRALVAEEIPEPELEEVGAFEALVVPLGAYLGEVVRRQLGGRWQFGEDPPSPHLVQVPGSDAHDPVGVVASRAEGGGTSLQEWYRAVEKKT